MQTLTGLVQCIQLKNTFICNTPAGCVMKEILQEVLLKKKKSYFNICFCCSVEVEQQKQFKKKKKQVQDLDDRKI